MTDAVTGQRSQTMTIDTAPVRYAVEAGYSPGGTFVFNQTAVDPPAGDPLRVPVEIARALRIRNGRMEMLDASGQPLFGTGSGQGPEIQKVLGADVLGGAIQLADGVVLSALPQTGYKTEADGSGLSITAVSESGDVAIVTAQISTTEPGVGVLPQRRVYRHVGSDYVLEEIRTDLTSSSPGIQTTGTATVRFENVSWMRNTARDAARAAGQDPNTWTDGASNVGPPWTPPGCDPNSNSSCDPHDSPSTGTGTGGGGGGCSFVPGGANIVYQHGILSNGITWGDPAENNKIIGRTRCVFPVGFDLAPSQANNGLQDHATQTTLLDTRVTSAAAPAAPNGLILVGHSQGGLIARRVAQREWHPELGLGNKVRAVVTIGTPHQGANIARNLSTTGLSATTGLFDGVLCRVISSGRCSSTRNALLTLGNGILALPGSTPAMQDLVPDSPAMRLTNGAAEAFPRFGIQHYIAARWSFAAVAGDYAFTDGGPTIVGIVNAAFFGTLGGGILASIISIWHPGCWGLAAKLLRAAYELDKTDRWYNRITAGSNRTDGIVEGTSQIYPNAIRNFEAIHPTSHLGETNTFKSFEALQLILRDGVGVPTRQ